MCTVSVGWRAAHAQAPLGTARNLASHHLSVLRLPLVIATGRFSSQSGVFTLPPDPFLLPAALLTGI